VNVSDLATMRLGFRAKTVIGIAAIEAVMLLVLVWSSHSQLEKSTNEQIAQRAETTAALFATLAKDAVLATDLASLESFTRDMIRNPGVVYVRVTGYGEELAVAGNLPETLGVDDVAGAILSDGVFDTSLEISEAGRVYGRVWVGLSNERVATILSTATRNQTFIAGAEIILVALFSIALGTYLTRHLGNLRQGVRALASGQLGVQIEASGRDELADVAGGFNTMSSRLKDFDGRLRREIQHSHKIACALQEREKLLEDHTSNLENMVVERTRAIRGLADMHAEFIKHANAPIFALDEHGDVVTWNDKAAELTGRSSHRAIGVPFTEVFDVSTSEPTDWATVHAEREVRVRAENGKQLLWLMGVTVRSDELGHANGFAFVGHDVTERHEMQRQVAQASKLATLGEMATGVAHELNQPLVVIAMAIENCLRKLERGTLTSEITIAKLSSVLGQVERASGIINRMRTFGRKADSSPEPFELNDAVNDSLGMMEGQLRLEGIEVCVDADATRGCKVSGHKSQFEQVFVNLILNAKDSMVSAKRVKPIILVTTQVRGDGALEMRVEDNGQGITAEAMEHIFEPFYTSKSATSGTGLGLSISYGIVQAMQGHLTAENGAVGACFLVVLPCLEKDEIAA
jgi:PAS domain S-box-containing protein